MPILDAAGNALPGASTGAVLGFVEPAQSAEILPLEMYRFLLEPIRSADLQHGALFAKRFLDGPQALWVDTQARIFALKDIHNITKVPDGLLKYLKNLLGWTPDLDAITSSLDDLTLRRLIAASAPLWKQRGVEDATLNVLRLVTGARLRLYNWFDLRWVLDETILGEDHQGLDSHLISLPSEGDDAYRSNIRIVDDGSLNRTLVEGLVRLMRASGERIEVSYITFLDLFTVADDNAQWRADQGSLGTVADGALSIPANTINVVNVEGSNDWSNYTAYWRVQGNGFVARCLFYYQNTASFYAVMLFLSGTSDQVVLFKGGTGALLFANYAFGALQADTYYGVRVTVTPEGAANRIKVYIDGNLVIDTTDTGNTSGTIGIQAFGASNVKLAEIEMFQHPLATTSIEINT